MTQPTRERIEPGKERTSEQRANYASGFQGSEAVTRYFRKLDNRLDRLRDRQETEILGHWLSGRLFDCTIGVGRFIGRLPRVTQYAGMDLSSEFVTFVREAYPDALVEVGDLTKGIPQPDAAYDCVLCLRSLSAIGHLDKILPEMLRIARPGGLVAFDYGREPKRNLRIRGSDLNIDSEDLDGVLARMDADVVARMPLDGILARLKMRLRVFRFLTGRYGRWIPDPLLMAAERALVHSFWQRELIFLRKHAPRA